MPSTQAPAASPPLPIHVLPCAAVECAVLGGEPPRLLALNARAAVLAGTKVGPGDALQILLPRCSAAELQARCEEVAATAQPWYRSAGPGVPGGSPELSLLPNGPGRVLVLFQDHLATPGADPLAWLQALPVAALLLAGDSDQILGANAALCSLIGRGADQAPTGRLNDQDWFPAEVLAALGPSGGELNVPSAQLRRSLGGNLPVLLQLRPVPTALGSARLMVLREDLGEPQLLRELELMRQKFEATFDASVNYTVISRVADGTFLAVNRAFTRLTGYSVEEGVGRRAVDLQLYADPAQREEAFGQLRATGFLEDFPFTLRARDGQFRECLLSARLVQIDAVACAVSVVRDETDLHRKERALARSEALFSAAFHNSRDCITITQGDKGTFLDVNEAFERLSGYTRDELLAHTSLELGLVPTPGMRAKLVQILAEEGGVTDFPWTLRNRSGESRECLLSASRIDLGPPMTAVGVLRDVSATRQRERELRDSERKYAAIFHNSLDAMAITRDADGVLLDVNGAWEALTGYAREEAVGHSLADLGPIGRMRPAVGDSKPGGGVRPSDRPILLHRRDGEQRHCLQTLFPVQVKGEACQVSISHDITDALRREGELRESEQKFSAAFHASVDAIVLSRAADGRILDVNQAFERISGCTHSEVVDHSAEQLGLIELPGGRPAFVERLMHEGSVVDFLCTLHSRGGDTRDLRLTAYPIQVKEEACIVSVGRDITLERQRERALQESEAKFSAAFRASPEAMAIVRTESGEVLDVNAAWCRLTGYSREEVIGHHPADIGIVDASLRESLVERLRHQPEVRDQDWTLRRRDGQLRHVLHSAYRVEIDGSPSHVSVVRDRSEELRRERELRESEAKFAAAFRGSVDTMLITRASDGFVLDLNEAFVVLTGFERAHMLGRTTLELGLGDPEQRSQVLNQVKMHGSVREAPVNLRDRAGRLHECLETVFGVDIDGEAYLVKTLRDVSQSRRVEHAIRRLAEGSQVDGSNPLLASLVRDLAAALDVEHAWVALARSAQGQLQVVVSVRQGMANPVLLAPLEGSAAAEVLKGSLCLWAKDATALFPADKLLAQAQAQGAAGTPLRDSGGHVFGVVMVAGTQPLADPELVRALLQVFGERAAHEFAREQAETALRDSERRFAALFQASPVALSVGNGKTGMALDVNQAWETLFRRKRLDCIGRSGLELGLWQNLEDRTWAMRTLQDERKFDGMETWVRRADGVDLLCRMSARLIDLDRQPLLIFTLEDITERKRAEDALRRSEAQLSEAQRIAHLGNWEYDLRSGAGTWSDEVFRLLGYDPGSQAPTLEAFLARVHEADRPGVEAALARAFDPTGPGIYAAEHRAATHSGPARVLLQRGQVSFDEQRVPVRLFGTMLDVTEQRTARRQVEEMNAQLEQRVRERTSDLARALDTLRKAQQQLVRSEKLVALGSLVAGVAHELNTPIGNALTVASALQDYTAEIEGKVASVLTRSALTNYMQSARSASDLLMRNLQRAAELIASFKQVAVDQTSSQRRRFQLSALVSEIVLTLSPMVKKTPYRVNVEVAEGLFLDSYPGPLGQVLTNLLQNSLLHAFEGRTDGRIDIRAQCPDNTEVELLVTDNGCGIPERELPRVFDPFFTTKLGSGGTGLGLHIVHNIVTNVLGGRLALSSEPGQGTRFTLSLPLVAPYSTPPGEALPAL